MQTAMKAVEKVVDAMPNAITKRLHGDMQRMDQPGVEADMHRSPEYIRPYYRGSGKLTGKVAIITGGDSGIGRATAIHFAREGCQSIAIICKGGPEDTDAVETVRLAATEGARCIALAVDVGDDMACSQAVDIAVREFGTIDILVNNAGVQHYRHNIEEITKEQLLETFNTNIFGMFYMTKACLPHMKEGSSIINTTSVTAYQGMGNLLDYSATKGSIVSFTRSLAQQLATKGIRVNAVAPGPIWTPLLPATFPKAAMPQLESMPLMKRVGQPSEVAPSFVFLASDDGSYFTGQVLHPNGGIPTSS